MAKIDSYFQKLKDAGASDLHLLVGAPPKLRIHGDLEPIPGEPVQTQAALEELLYEIIDSRQKAKFQKTNDLDFAYGLEGVARFRCNYLMQKMGLGAVFRIIPERIKTIAELNLPKAVEKFAHIPNGLILVTG